MKKERDGVSIILKTFIRLRNPTTTEKDKTLPDSQEDGGRRESNPKSTEDSRETETNDGRS